MLLLDGLEKMYTAAKEYDVDVVNCTKNYNMSEDGIKLTPVNLRVNTTNEIIVEEDLEWRVKGQLRCIFGDTNWRRLIKTSFLLEKRLFFPEAVKRCEDVVWTYGLLFNAEKVLYLPNACYLYRLSEASLTRRNRTSLQVINSRMSTVIDGTQWLGKIIAGVHFFEQNPEYKYTILEHLINRMFWRCFNHTFKFSQFDIYESIKDEFGEKFGKNDVLVAELCSLINAQKKELHKLNEQLKTK